MEDLIIIGTGNSDIVRLIEDINLEKKRFNLIGFLEKDAERVGTDVLGYPVIGNDDLLFNELKDVSVVNNVFGNSSTRQNVCNQLHHKYNIQKFPNLIHPTVSTNHISFGIGNIIYEYVSLATKVQIGDFNLIFPLASIAHEAKIGSIVLLAPGATIGSRTVIGNRVMVGYNAVINMGKKVCDDGFVGAGAVVIDSISEPERVFGNPALPSHLPLRKFSLIKNILKMFRLIKKWKRLNGT